MWLDKIRIHLILSKLSPTLLVQHKSLCASTLLAKEYSLDPYICIILATIGIPHILLKLYAADCLFITYGIHIIMLDLCSYMYVIQQWPAHILIESSFLDTDRSEVILGVTIKTSHLPYILTRVTPDLVPLCDIMFEWQPQVSSFSTAGFHGNREDERCL